jgi:hypothetical protein
MTEFVRQVRQLLDRTARGGRRWLCARVPCYQSFLDPLGLDMKALVAAGLDMVNASATYFTTQRQQLAFIRRQTSGAKLYFEMCHSIWNGPRLTPGYDAFTFRRTTPEQFYTTAHLAYARGVDGMSTFNFVYYRDHGGEGRGPFDEPPFEILGHLSDRNWLARQPQHWFLAKGWRPSGTKPTPVPRKVELGQAYPFFFDMAPPSGGWQKAGRLRVEAERPLGDSRWQAHFNDVALVANDDVSEPYENPYSPLLGEPAARRAWTVPASALKDGGNRLDLTLEAGEPATIVYLDLAIS